MLIILMRECTWSEERERERVRVIPKERRKVEMLRAVNERAQLVKFS